MSAISEPSLGKPAATGASMPAEAVEFATSFGPVLRGVRWSEGTDWVILLHEPKTDLDAWDDLPAYLLEPGVTVIAIDLPGHGLSDDPWQPNRLNEAVLDVLARVRADGANRISLVAAAESAVAGLFVAAEGGFDGLVLLTPALPACDERMDPRAIRVPKLILVGSLDDDRLTDARAVFDRCAGWSVFCSIPTAAQGTALLGGDWGSHVREHVAGFLRDGRRRRLGRGAD